MDLKTSILLENLLQRVLRDEETGQRTLPGVITNAEWEALRTAVSILGGTSDDSIEPVSPGREEVAVPTSPADNISVDLTALELPAPQSPTVTLCIDFGTAMSKAFAVRANGKDISQMLDLALGHRAGNERLRYPVTSSLWIGDGGLVFVGREAVEQSLNHGGEGRRRFDSPKQWLSQGMERPLSESVLDASFNPTNVRFTVEDAILFYLGYLTDLATTELEESFQTSRYVRRRFALPCWDKSRDVWGRKTLSRLLAYAQVVADTFHGRWASGIPIEEVKAALEQMRTHDPPVGLVEQGVLEPLAACGGRLPSTESFRGLLMVVDVGAGTTDFGLFLVHNQGGDTVSAYPIEGCSRGVRQAGDVVDNMLRMSILAAVGVGPGHPNHKLINNELLLRVRELKERLFEDGEVTGRLSNDASFTISLEEFLASQPVSKFRSLLRAAFVETIEAADKSFPARFDGVGVAVVLTGGGAGLPMVKEMVKEAVRVGGYRLPASLRPALPVYIENHPELADEYGRLAVAIGGCVPDGPSERPFLTEMPGEANQKWEAGGYYTKGL
jgi:hypothetical protein